MMLHYFTTEVNAISAQLGLVWLSLVWGWVEQYGMSYLSVGWARGVNKHTNQQTELPITVPDRLGSRAGRKFKVPMPATNLRSVNLNNNTTFYSTTFHDLPDMIFVFTNMIFFMVKIFVCSKSMLLSVNYPEKLERKSGILFI